MAVRAGISNDAVSELDKAHDEFIEASLWHGALEPAAAILAAHPAIATHSVYSAAILGDAVAVRRFVARDRASATGKGGPKGWDALTYLCFSKFLRLEPARTDGFVSAATALLDAGADPNTGFHVGEAKLDKEWECALYGAAGVAHHPELTRLLVERGANPNDGEVAYHTPETLDNRAMKVLVESGKLTQDTLRWMLARKMNWHDGDGFAWLLDHGADPNHPGHWSGRPLHDALAHGCSLLYFELLLDHGADPTLPAKDGRSTFAGAARMARVDVLDLFERRGFSGPLEGDDAFLAACARADEATARRMVAADPGIVARVQARDPTLLIEFAGADNAPAVRLLLDLGFDAATARTEPSWSRGATALHEATWHCRLETVDLLVARGAPLAARHEQSGRTPFDVALLSLVQQSEWTPDEKSIPIARALLAAGAPFRDDSMTLAAAICLDRAADIERLSRSAGGDEKQIALAAAAFHGKVPGLRLLIGLGADLDAVNPGLQHAAPLHNAVTSGSLAAVKTLVEAGARLDTRDIGYRLTPLDWAEWHVREATRARDAREYAEIAAYLRDRR
jgi:ankyrin repeat protein